MLPYLSCADCSADCFFGLSAKEDGYRNVTSVASLLGPVLSGRFKDLHGQLLVLHQHAFFHRACMRALHAIGSPRRSLPPARRLSAARFRFDVVIPCGV